ncbi:hypothetical protein [Algibacter pacificus]|uniref:hypothetical protein n=1 Tax=Algibacter pacificus TaxID=2599389 RepID=UPI0011C75512|nr:hypothetical protein [Algibacter pacificus]
MKNKFKIIVLLLWCAIGYGQKKITWAHLAKVTFADKYFPAYDEYFMYPTFSESVKALEGTQITITGYFLNIDPEAKLYMLSKGPMSACFFCGQGGPETAVELQFSKTPKFKTDDIISVTGSLKLNKDNVEHFNYILTGCTALKLK